MCIRDSCNSAEDGEKFLNDILKSSGIEVCSLCGSPLTNKFHSHDDHETNLSEFFGVD